MKKTCVGIMLGGKSSEHKVSLLSAMNVINAIDKELFDIVLIGIDCNGQWQINDPKHYLLHPEDPSRVSLIPVSQKIAVLPGNTTTPFICAESLKPIPRIDVIFSVLHGATGENGSVQGLLNIINIPFVGPDVLSSALCMDKDICKRLLRDAGLNIAPFITLYRKDIERISFENVTKVLGLPLFIKPACEGSSVGVSKVHDESSFEKSIRQAFDYGDKVIIEQSIVGREIECAILGNDNPQASLCGEVILTDEFYAYDTKYLNSEGAHTEIPALITPVISDKIREVSLKAYHALNCAGMARVDVFLTKDDDVIINEINTLPGFTSISMYPKLQEVSGIPYTQLITQLIRLAIERQNPELSL